MLIGLHNVIALSIKFDVLTLRLYARPLLTARASGNRRTIPHFALSSVDGDEESGVCIGIKTGVPCACLQTTKYFILKLVSLTQQYLQMRAVIY
jgi:hypothetical protein